MIGRVVGNFKILEKVGEGGMGAVYRGVDLMLERDVAVKVLHAELIHQANVVERFRTEAVTLARINHPNVATLYSFVRQGDDFFMVMEFVRGESIEAIIRRAGPMPPEQAGRLFFQALDGIAHAHQLGIVHRDVKPANIMVTGAGTVKVMDFGIARVLGKSRVTKTGHLIGTLEYMSPEQIRGQEVDARSDIYSLGILLYEMLSGRVPFEGDSDFELMRAQIERTPAPLRPLAPHVPEAVEQAIFHALEKAPAARFQTVPAFRQALEEILRARPEPAPDIKPSRAEPTTRTGGAVGAAEAAKATRMADTPPATAAPAAKATRIADAQQERPARPFPERTTPAETRAVEGMALEEAPDGPEAAVRSVLADVRARFRLDALVQKPYVGLGVAALLALLLLLVFWPSNPPSAPDGQEDLAAAAGEQPGALLQGNEPLPSNQAGGQPVVVPPPAAPAPAGPVVVERPGPSGTQGVAALLEKARAYVAQNRLTTPADDNAVELCLQALQLDPGNREALGLLRQIVERYVAWGDDQAARGAFARAREQYRKGLDVSRRIPGAPGPLAAEAERKLAEVEARLAENPDDARLGSVRVVVRPFGDIYINDSRKARETIQPYTEDLSPGAYRIRAVHPVFGTWEKQVAVEAGAAQEVLFNFTQEYRLTVTSDPPNAEIYVDGKATGRYTPSLLTLSPGRRAIEVRKAGYSMDEGAQRLTLEHDVKEPLHFILRPRQ